MAQQDVRKGLPMKIRLVGARIERTSDGLPFFFEERFGFAYVLESWPSFSLSRFITSIASC